MCRGVNDEMKIANHYFERYNFRKGKLDDASLSRLAGNGCIL